jgi:hypothetical protein
MTLAQEDKYAKQHTFNGIYYAQGLGCQLSPSCFGCPESEDCTKPSDGARKHQWLGEIPDCLNPFNCLDCKDRHCSNGGMK